MLHFPENREGVNLRISRSPSGSQCFAELKRGRFGANKAARPASCPPLPTAESLKFLPKRLNPLAYTLSFWKFIMKDVVSTNWVLIPKFCELKGYTVNAVRAKIKNGIWKEGNLWRKGPDNRIVIDVNAVNRWMGGANG
jgi:hypothetical protein